MKKLNHLCLIFVLNLAGWGLTELDWASINPATNQIVDSKGNSLILHGVNAVYKIPPWIPSSGEWDVRESLNEKDMEFMKSIGFNVIRLGVMFPGVNPAENFINHTYIEQIKTMINKLGEYGIYTMMDCHQDVLSRYFCGEGIPDYLVKNLKKRKHFPKPLPVKMEFNETTEYPELEDCLERNFGFYYATTAVGETFQELYDTSSEIFIKFKYFWQTLAAEFKDNPNVIGYELINEPSFPLYNLVSLWPGYSDKHFLSKIYKELNDGIRKYDDKHIIFYEPIVADYLRAGFKEGPGGQDYNDRQALSYHIYCPLVSKSGAPKSALFCKWFDKHMFKMRQKDIKKLKQAGILTEYGALDNSQKSIEEIIRINDLADKFLQGTIYWTYKDYHDITTANRDGTETLYYLKNSTQQDAKVHALSRTYPRQIAGIPESFTFDSETKKFSLSFKIDSAVASNTTEIYLNKNLNYPNGYSVKVNVKGEQIFPEDNLFHFQHSSSVASGTTVSIEISKK